MARSKQGCAGQGTLEYAMLVAVVVAALIGMQVYLKHAMSGRLKGAGDQMGQQWDPDQGFSKKDATSDSTRKEETSAENGTTTTIVGQDIQHQDINETISKGSTLFNN